MQISVTISFGEVAASLVPVVEFLRNETLESFALVIDRTP